MKNNIWLSIEEYCSLNGVKLETVRRKCKSGTIPSKVERNGKYKNYYIPLEFLSKNLQEKYINEYLPQKPVAVDATEISEDLEVFTEAPSWAKKNAEKYLDLFEHTKNLNYKETIDFISDWNNKYPDKKTSYPSLMQAKKRFEKGGKTALLTRYGHHNNATVLDDNYFNYFKSVYLKEGAPSVNNCWLSTMGFARSCDKNINLQDFPSHSIFMRKLKAEIPEQVIYKARYGQAAWNKKYANYIERDISNLIAGECWVSDHAQIDIAVNFNEKVCFPWVTVFRDAKTAKWLGWLLHAESPNSDHIFQAFYYGVLEYGLPSDIYLDNGKDYRCKDFAGGRSSVKVKHSTAEENSLMRLVDINVHFALPYNAQTKPIERDFLKIKTSLSKGSLGYRGGKVTERPEKLKDEIKNNKIMQFDEFKTLFDDFIINFLNKKPSTGKALKGKCPDELWAEEFKVKKVISKDALKLFCMRTSRAVKIGRNGIYDSKLEVTYWDEWMITEKGRKVYIRRDINAYQEAWVFDAETDEFLGKANMNHAVSFLAKTNVEKSALKKAIEVKNKEKKIIKSYLQTQYNPSNSEMVENLKRALDKTEFECKPVVSKITNTAMEQVVNIERQSRKNNMQFDYKPEVKPKKKLYLTEGERLRDLMKAAM